METAIGTWSAPIASSWGFYLVRPLERRGPTAAEAMDAAAAEVRRKKSADAVARSIARMAADYEVIVRSHPARPRSIHVASRKAPQGTGTVSIEALRRSGRRAARRRHLTSDAHAHASRTSYLDITEIAAGQAVVSLRSGVAPRSR